MKKLIFILVAFFFVAASCQKADIRPNSQDDIFVNGEDDFSKTLRNNDGSVSDDSTGDTGGITDPNNDEDEDKKKRKR